MQVLERIVEAKRADVAERKRRRPLQSFRSRLWPSRRSLRERLRDSPCGFVLECKRSAPSAGLLRDVYEPVALAREYASVADGISVLTDAPFFGGALEHLRQVSEAVDLPLLCKDFVVDPYQIDEARDHGADAILLMLSVLDPAQLQVCLARAAELEMDALVEVHDEVELDAALRAGAKLLGINNRDLKTLGVSLATTERLAPRVPPDVTLISESGITRREDVRRLRGQVHGFLIGSSLMRRDDLAHAAREIAYGRVKVCGLRRAEDAVAAWLAGASYGGMIFAPGSPRLVSGAQARALVTAAPLRWVGVFVDAPNEAIARAAADLELSAVQLHGDEPAEQLRELRSRLPERCEIWKSVRVPGLGSGTRSPVPPTEATGADRVLLDTFDPRQRGGTGRRFDWQLVAPLPGRSDIVLAGGLDPDNAVEADALGTWALDVNSGVERAPAQKDPALLRRFFAAVRRGEACSRGVRGVVHGGER